VREKRVQVVIVELLEKATRRLQTADPPSPGQKTADWRPPLLGGRQARATLRQALFVRLE
jgi:hypothetical protein